MKKWKLILSLLICTILAVTGCLFLRLRNGIKIHCVSEYTTNEHLIFYHQDNSEWSDDILGSSSYTMKTSGCLVTCIASAISANDASVTPGTLNILFTINNVYDDEGNLQWNKLQKIEGIHVALYDDVDNDYIEQCLEKGRYPIIRVRRHILGSYHYVLIVGTDHSEYICMDPLEDTPMKLSAYGNYVYAIRCVWFE